MAIEPKPRKLKDGSIVYYLRGRYLKTDINHSLGVSTKAEADKLAAQILPNLLQRIRDNQLRSDTFAGVAAAYVAHGNPSDRHLQRLVAAFGSQRTNDITDDAVKAWANAQRAKNGAPWKAATKNRQALTPFQAVCNFGARQKPPKCMMRLIEDFPPQKTTIVAAPEDWIKWVIPQMVHDGHPALAALILFMTTTAARVSEALRVEWRDVNLETGEALLRQTKGKRGGNPRLVKLAPSLVAAMHVLAGGKPINWLTGRVFTYANRSSVEHLLKRRCAVHGKPYYSSHQWGRHAFAERLLRMNKSLVMVKEAGGWRSLQVLVDNYGHLERTHVSETILQGAASLDIATPAIPLKLAKD